MLPKYPTAIGVLTLLAGTATLAHADDAATRKALQQQYAKISQAYKTKSIKPIQDVSTPDYTLTLPSGQIVTRQQMEAQFATQLSFLQTISKADAKLGKIEGKGKEVKVDAQETITAVISDPQTAGKVHTMDSTNQYRDTWVKSGSGWLRKHSDLQKMTMKMDGKPLDINAMMGSGQGRMQKPMGQTKK
jgi:hypothetical protein